MAKHSNTVEYNSPDGLPSNPWPMKPLPTHCSNEDCQEKITEEICPYCGTENTIDYEPDYEAGFSED